MTTDKLIKDLLDTFYKNVEEAGKDHYKILFPEQLVAALFAKSIQIMADVCVVAVPDTADTTKLTELLQDEGIELQLKPGEE